MRTYGRVPANPLDLKGPKKWVTVETDAAGFNDMVYLTALAQVLLLYLNESPFWANYGIPARDSIMQQVAPDYYVTQTQIQFSQFFAILIVAKVAIPTPTYNITIVTHAGVKLNFSLPVPI